MKVSISWLKELVDLKVSMEELITLIPMRTIGLKETTKDFLELDMKGYNRADLLSMRGLAREVATITDSEVKFKDEEKFIWEGQNLPSTPVSIEDNDLAIVQIVAKIENLKVEQSDKTWIKKLSDSGMRSIDAITDITNLIMLEFGQPLHAFNAATVKDETINVRLASSGEEITTLDGKLRKLDSQDIVLADSEKPLDVAGIMGGKDTEVIESTTTILLSASLFNPTYVRRTASRLGLYSEASKRFQHGLTKKRLLQAVDAAIKMYQQLGGKLTAITLVGDLEDRIKTVNLTQKKLNDLLGIEISPKQVEDYLEKLGFKLASHMSSGNTDWEVTVPYWRLDINIEEDLIEEVARIYGYEKIPARELVGKEPEKIDQTLFEHLWSLKKACSEAGLTEVQTYSFYSKDVLDNLSWNEQNLIKLANPISSETEYLREDIWPNLLEVVAKNMRNGYKDIAIFELGKVYGPNPPTGGDELPNETYRLSIALMNGSDNPSAELYQIFQTLSSHLGGVSINLDSKKGEYEKKYFHPKRFAFLESHGPERASESRRGGIAEVHQRFTDKFGVSQRVAVLEIELTEQ